VEEVRLVKMEMLWLLVPAVFLALWWMRRSANAKTRDH